MHVKTKKIVVTGMIIAISIISMILGTVIEMNTLFFLAFAAFLIGIVIREYGCRMGASAFVAAVMLGGILVPNKLYVFTYAAFAMYILVVEIGYRKLANVKSERKATIFFWLLKYMIFNLIFIPVLLLFPELLIGRTLEFPYHLFLIAGGQIILPIFDKSYEYFIKKFKWTKYI